MHNVGYFSKVTKVVALLFADTSSSYKFVLVKKKMLIT